MLSNSIKPLTKVFPYETTSPRQFHASYLTLLLLVNSSGKMPEEKFSLSKWMQKVSVLGYDNYDERKEDNTLLVLLGKPMFDRCALLKAQLANVPVNYFDDISTSSNRNSIDGETKKSRSKRPTFSPESPLLQSAMGNRMDTTDITSPSPNGIEGVSNTPVETDGPSRNSFEGETKNSKRKPRTTLQGAIDAVLNTPLRFSPESSLLKSIVGNTLDTSAASTSNRNSFEGETKDSKRKPRTTLQGAIDAVRNTPAKFSPESSILKSIVGNTLDATNAGPPTSNRNSFDGEQKQNRSKPSTPESPIVKAIMNHASDTTTGATSNRNSSDGEQKQNRSKPSSFSPENPLIKPSTNKSNKSNKSPVGTNSLTDGLIPSRSSFDGAQKRRPRASTLQGAIDSVKNKRSSFSPERMSTLSPG